MSAFFATDPFAIIDALAAHDFDTAAMLLNDSSGELDDFLANQQFVTVTGTLDGAGAATLAHNVDLTSATVLLVQGFYDGGGGQSKPLTVTSVDATDVTVTGGTALADCRVTLVISVGFISF